MNRPELLEHWYKTTDWILDKCDRFPKSTRFTLGGRIVNLALDILESLVDATYRSDKRASLVQANHAFEKLRILFRICFDRHYLSETQYFFIQTEINTAGRMCGGWIKSCAT